MSDLSHDVRKPFSANETFNAELLIKLFKLLLLCYPVASFVRLTSGFEELFIRETERVKKPGGRGGGDKREKKNHFHFFIKLILDYWISSKNGLLDT